MVRAVKICASSMQIPQKSAVTNIITSVAKIPSKTGIQSLNIVLRWQNSSFRDFAVLSLCRTIKSQNMWESNDVELC